MDRKVVDGVGVCVRNIVHTHTHAYAHAHAHACAGAGIDKPQYIVECIFFYFFSHIHTTHNFGFFFSCEDRQMGQEEQEKERINQINII